MKHLKMKPWMIPFLIILSPFAWMINLISNSTHFCTFWDWHQKPDDEQFKNGALYGTCPRCGEKMKMTNNGIWETFK